SRERRGDAIDTAMSVPGDNQPASGSMRTLMIDNQKVIDELNARIQRRDQEVKIIQQISSEINSTLDLEHMLGIILDSLDRVLGFKHCMILLSDNAAASLSVAALRGYENQQPGATVPVGQGPSASPRGAGVSCGWRRWPRRWVMSRRCAARWGMKRLRSNCRAWPMCKARWRYRSS